MRFDGTPCRSHQDRGTSRQRDLAAVFGLCLALPPYYPLLADKFTSSIGRCFTAPSLFLKVVVIASLVLELTLARALPHTCNDAREERGTPERGGREKGGVPDRSTFFLVGGKTEDAPS